MDKRNKKIMIFIGLGVVGILTCGAFLNFYPFLGDDLVVREIQFCTFVICMVMAVCTVLIISKKK